jgi:hypothetical protein
MKDVHTCVLYGLSATLMNISSKSMISTYFINPTFTLLLIQHTLIVIFGSFKHYNVTWPELKECSLISLFSLGNIFFSAVGLKFVNLPMYVALRKLCTANIFIIDSFILQQPYTLSSAIGVLGISAGAIIAGFNDLTSDFSGYCLVFFANFMNAILLVQIRMAKERVPTLKSFRQVYVCSIISIPYTAVLLFTFEEVVNIAMSPYAHTWGMYSFVIYGGLLGVVCNYMLFKCANEISPMATSVAGNAKDFFSMIIGFFAFSDVQPNTFFIIGLFTSTAGAMIYSLGKLVEIKKISV